jgi:stage II sporulation protein AA (anti-sigma F factor antagonist)
VVLTLQGEYAIDSIGELRALLHGDDDGTDLVLDLTDVHFVDSSALGEIVQAARRRTEAGALLVLAGARGPLLRLLQLTQLDSVLLCAASVDVGVRMAHEHARWEPPHAAASRDLDRDAHFRAVWDGLSEPSRRELLTVAATGYGYLASPSLLADLRRQGGHLVLVPWSDEPAPGPDRISSELIDWVDRVIDV